MSNILDALEAKLDQVLDTQQAIQQVLAGEQPEEASSKLLTFKEAMVYCDLSESYGRLLCHKKEIPHYKPRGRRLYFNKSELDQWLMQGKSALVNQYNN